MAAVLGISIVSAVPGPPHADEPGRVVEAGAVAANPPAPLDQIRQILHKQATALGRGDRAGWLAPVAPALHDRYSGLFRTLRALRVTTVEYRITGGRLPTLTVELSWCFTTCAGERPSIAQALTFRDGGDAYRLIGLARPQRPTHLQPTPWEAGDLVVGHGRRVTVAAPKALAGRLAEVITVADRAAVVIDRYAALLSNRQTGYRIFLASEKQWRTWYGGKGTDWAAGYMQPLAGAGADVVIHLNRIRNRAALREVVQHELGHVATIGGVQPGAADMWLVEGVAEYIGMRPRAARTTYNQSVLRSPTRLALSPLPDRAGKAEVAAFYAHGHFAVECLVTKFGEARAMEFVRLRLRLGDTLEVAARSVFGRGFAGVEQTCVDWLRHQAG